MTVVRQLPMVQIALEEHEIRARKVQEQIWCLAMQIPIGVSSAPERMLLVHPFPFFLVLLGSLSAGRSNAEGKTEYSPSSDLRVSSKTPFRSQKPLGKDVRRP